MHHKINLFKSAESKNDLPIPKKHQLIYSLEYEVNQYKIAKKNTFSEIANRRLIAFSSLLKELKQPEIHYPCALERVFDFCVQERKLSFGSELVAGITQTLMENLDIQLRFISDFDDSFQILEDHIKSENTYVCMKTFNKM